MCWGFSFSFSGKKKRKVSSDEKKRRNTPGEDALHGKGRPVATDIQEKRRSREARGKRTSRETEAPPELRQERSERRRSQYHHQYGHATRDQYRPALNVQVPDMWHRSVDPESRNSSQEQLLNPRPHRSTHQRQRHPRHTSQSTLRGRGAKRDPPSHLKSKKNLRPEPSRGWSFFSPSPPKTSSRRNHGTLNSPAHSHRSSQEHRSRPSHEAVSDTHHRSRQQQQAHTTRQSRSQTPNTTARRVPDRRFAVLAATNQALETVRRDAFSQPSPPPRRERVRRYDGVAVPTSQMPFNWDCVSSSQASAAYEPSPRQRRSRR
jgi:hypothetical protein